MTQISPDQLKNAAIAHGLSKVELEALELAIEGHSAESSAEKLNISPVAFRKRLGSVYKKFHILGDSQGKLNRLKTQLFTDVSATESSHERATESSSWVSREDKVDVSGFCGRDRSLDLLKKWIQHEQLKLLLLFGQGGIGKTMLAAKLAHDLQNEFDRVIWQSLRTTPNLQVLLTDLLTMLSYEPQHEADTELQISKFLTHLTQQRCLIVFDNADSLLQKGTLAGEYLKDFEEYGKLFRRIGEATHQSCVLITSREKPKETATLQGKNLRTRAFHVGGLKLKGGQKLLLDKGITATDEQAESLLKRYGGNPLALKIVATAIEELFGNDVSLFLKQRIPVIRDIEELLDQQFDRLSDLEVEIMYWLALNYSSTSPEVLQQDLIFLESQDALLNALRSLLWRSLIEPSGIKFKLQPVVSEYVLKRLVKRISHGFESQKQNPDTEALKLLDTHALMKATAQDRVRQLQEETVLEPIANRLKQIYPAPTLLEETLWEMLKKLQEPEAPRVGYRAGNIINLMRYFKMPLSRKDLSELTIRQAYLEDVELQETNFTHADLSSSVFRETITGIISVAFHPDGDRFAIGLNNGELRLWRVSDNKQIDSVQGHDKKRIWSIKFSTKGDFLISGGEDGAVHRWTTNQLRDTLKIGTHDQPVSSVAVSSDDRWIASSGEEGKVKIWDAETGEPIQELDHGEVAVWSVEFVPDRPWIISGSDRGVHLWDWKTATQTATFVAPSTDTEANQVYAIHISPDGESCVSGSADGKIRVWNLKTGQCQPSVSGHTQKIHSVRFSSDGQRIVSGGEDMIVRVWEATNLQQPQMELRGHTNQVWSVGFSPDCRRVISAGDDQTARLWDNETGNLLNTLKGYTRGVYALAFKDDRTLISGTDDGGVYFWDLARPSNPADRLSDHLARIRCLAYDPKSERLVHGSRGSSFKLWDVSDLSACRLRWTGRQHTNWVWCAAFSPDGKTLATGSEDYTVRLWDAETGEDLLKRPLTRQHRWVWCVAFCPSGRWLVSGGGDPVLRLWDVQNIHKPQHIPDLRGHTDAVWTVAFAPLTEGSGDNSLLASGGADRIIRLWNIKERSCKELKGHTGTVYAIAFSPDGQKLVSAGDDRRIYVWDVATASCIYRSEPEHSEPIRAISLSPDGRTIATGSEDETIGLWKFTSGQSVAPEVQKLARNRFYEGMKLIGVQGLNEAQKLSLKVLGASIEDKSPTE